MSAPVSAEQILLSRDVDLSKITFSEPKQNSNNAGRTIFINYNGGDLFLQTPCMISPFGISTWPGERGAPDKHTLDLSFAGREKKTSIQEFHDMLQGLTKLVLKTAEEKSSSWLKNSAPSSEFIGKIFTKMIRYSKDKLTGDDSTTYPPSFKLNLPTKDGDFPFKTYNADREEMDLYSMLSATPRPCKGARVTAIIQLSSIWVVGQTNFGVTWKVQTLLIQMPLSLQGYSFVTDNADNDDDDGDDDIPRRSDKLTNGKDASGENDSHLFM
jgi:hypothetical protein